MDILGEYQFLGSCTFQLTVLIPHERVKRSFFIANTPAEKDLPRKIGKKMAESGASPRFPVFLFHGYGSSCLKVEEGDPEWKNQPIWLSFAKLGLSKTGSFAFNRKTDTQSWERWLDHVCLEEDGVTDPNNIRVRPVSGTEALAHLESTPSSSNTFTSVSI